MRKVNKVNKFISNLNAILFFVGFPLFTTLFYGSGEQISETRFLTIGYRAFTAVVVLILIFLQKELPTLNRMGKLFLFLWIAYLTRIIFDLYIRTDSYYIAMPQKLLYINDSVVVCFLPLIGLFFSYRSIQWKKVFFILVVVLFYITLYGLININSNTTNNFRVKMNIAQSTLAFGFYSAATFLSGLTLLNTGRVYKQINKTFVIVIMIIGILGVFSAGSRGPLLGLIIAAFATPFIKLKFKYIFSFILLTFLLYIFRESITTYLSNEFILFERVTATVQEGDLSGRESYYADAIAQIKSNPFLGDWHMLYYNTGKGNFAHNIILTTWMSLGLIIGSIIIILYGYFIKKAIHLINAKNIYSFIGYLVLLSIVYSLTTGGPLCYKDTFNFAFGMLFLTTLPKSVLYQEANNNKQ